jgi:hypothetical protein
MDGDNGSTGDILYPQGTFLVLVSVKRLSRP